MTGRLRSTAPFALAVACALFLAGSFSGPPLAEAKKAKPRSRTWDVSFQADTLGQAPTGTITMAGAWRVIEDPDTAMADSAGLGPRILQQSDGEGGEAMNWIRFTKPVMEDGEVSVRFRIRSGELDPSVGVAFQVDRKGKNGYLVRVSGGASELVAHYILNGKRRDLKFAEIEAPAAGTWHTLGVRRKGITTTVFYDGTERMALRDERFGGGTVGLWTEDDTIADFTDLQIKVY